MKCNNKRKFNCTCKVFDNWGASHKRKVAKIHKAVTFNLDHEMKLFTKPRVQPIWTQVTKLFAHHNQSHWDKLEKEPDVSLSSPAVYSKLRLSNSARFLVWECTPIWVRAVIGPFLRAIGLVIYLESRSTQVSWCLFWVVSCASHLSSS